MSEKTGIQWTDETWNPLAGCSIVSPGCHNCYAMKMAKRLEAMGQKKYAGLTVGGRWTGKLNFSEQDLTAPLRWKKPRMVFVNSMSDLFHEDAPDEWIDRVWAVMAFTNHTYQILTKRAERMHAYMNQNRAAQVKAAALSMGFALEFEGISLLPKILHNVWLGVSCEDQKRADERIPWLLNTPASVRFLSCEPLIGQINLKPHLIGLGWAIIGGESGPGARPCDIDWIRDLVRQCQSTGTPVFIKQFGAHVIDRRAIGIHSQIADDECWPLGQQTKVDAFGRVTLKDKKGGDMEEWPTGLRHREFPKCDATVSS